MKKLAKRYKLADEYLFNRLPGWKKATVLECRKLNEASRILDDFIHEVAELAESNVELPGEKPAKKVVAKKKKPVRV